MKRIALLLLLVIASSAFRKPAQAKLSFDDLKYNFGFIHQGDIVTHDFTFTNTGDEPLVISDAEVACKCTTVDFPKTPVPKGAKGSIKVTFDSKSAMDRQERTVIVKSNASNDPVTLTFKCVVLKKK